MNISNEADRLIKEFRKLARISGGTGTSEPASIQCAIKCVERERDLVELIQQESHSDEFFNLETILLQKEELKQELESRL